MGRQVGGPGCLPLGWVGLVHPVKAHPIPDSHSKDAQALDVLGVSGVRVRIQGICWTKSLSNSHLGSLDPQDATCRSHSP